MPDLLGPCPCGKCKWATYQWGCEFRVNCLAYRLREERRALLEKLKAGGVKVDGHSISYSELANIADGLVPNGPGHLIFIPEAQG